MATFASRPLRTASALAVVALLVASAAPPAGYAALLAAPDSGGGAAFRISVADAPDAPDAPTAPVPGPGGTGGTTIGLTPGGAATLTRTVTTTTVPPRPDVVLLADTTGSMGPALADVKANARRIVADISAVQPDARFAVTEYRDETDSYAFQVNRDLTTDPAAVQEAVNTWTAVGGGDTPEANLHALSRIATGAVGFRAESSPIVVIFGDAPSHDPVLGHDLAGTVTALTARGIRVVAVDVVTSPYHSLDQDGQFTEITTRTGGVLLTAATAGDVSTAILAGIRAIQATVAARVSDCDPQLSATVEPAERTVDSGSRVDFTLAVRVDPKARNGEYACQVTYTVDGIAQGGPERLAVTVTGAAPDVPVLHSDTTLLDLGEASLGVATPARRVTLSNAGDYPLSVAATLAAQPAPAVFAITENGCGPVLAIGASCTLDVVATPRDIGTADTVLTLASSTDTGGRAAQSLTVRTAGRSPTLAFNPGVGRPGQVVTALGQGFPPTATVSLSWADGTATVTVATDADGRFAVPMVVFPDGRAGPRAAVASVPAVGTVTSGTFLVQSATAQPGVFTRRR
ncbi:VWA domain-containing protein [Micromonospora sp. NPDC023956]|uniref:VWA domain-containing protein n=1 Tax=Micromonospora sp. NPDC023956 TaxID=3155722 RepID=UPI0033DA9BD6